MHLRPLRHWNRGMIQPLLIHNFLGIVQTDPQDAPCTMCEENTYGYNAVTGCQECSCRTEGTNGDMSCRYVSDVLKSTSIDIPAK